MYQEEELQTIMSLIMYGGEAKSSAFEAIAVAKEGDFDKADEKIKQAQEALNLAHHAQTEMLTKEASGDGAKVGLLMVHGQDHLMTSICFVDLAKEFIDVYKELKK
ncbi:MAG: PTS lactose/cellobiose transporter subunit IIA [Streptococcus sp.]|nr:PTS lactose/cellobiose transporter subunit IIA [Streptococcus sp.]